MPSQFSRPDRQPLANQSYDSILKYAGYTATWRAYMSASAGVPAAGIGSATYYRESTITAIFGRGIPGMFQEMQLPAGLQAAGVVMMASPHKIGRQDEILWRGTTYRVEADPVPVSLTNYFQVQLKRGDG
jgi:hypothetical protein